MSTTITHIETEKQQVCPERSRKVPSLRFKEFDGDWSKILMAKIFPFIRNGFVGTATPYYIENGVKYLQGKNVKGNRIKDDGMIYINDFFHHKNKKSQLKLNDIVMVQSGHVGECAVITDSYVNANCHALLVLTPTEEVNSFFYSYFYYSPYGLREIYKIRTGNTIAHVLSSDVKKIEVPFPTLPEQQRIASFLSAVDEKIQQLSKKKELLEQYKKGVMQQLFSQKLRFKAENGNPYPDWDWVGGNELFDNISDKKHNSDLPILAITQDQGAIPRELINYQMTVTDASVASYKVVQKGDFIISLRTFQGGIEFSDYHGICSPAYNILRPSSEEVDRTFYKFYLKTSFYIRQLQKNLEGIRDGKMISYKYFSEIKVPFPSHPEQQKIATYLSSIDIKIESVNNQITQTQSFKKGLLQQMFI